VAGSDGGAFEYTGDVRRSFRTFGAAEGIADTGVTTFGEDFAGNLWVGTESSGAKRIARDGMTTYGGGDGLAPAVVSVTESGAAIYAVSRQRTQRVRLSRFDGERFTIIDPAFPPKIHWYGWGTGSLTFQDRMGDWWIPTGEGLCRFDGGLRGAPKAVYTTRDGLASNDIFGLLEDAAGDVWIATTAPTGLSRWERSTGRFHRYEDMPREGEITALERQPQAGVWAGGGAGLFRSRGDRLERIDTPGVPPNSASALHIDRAGRLWAGNRLGLFRCDSPAAAHPSFQSIFTDAVQRLTEDRWGRIYACTSRGVVRLDPATGLRRLYTSADGLAGSDIGTAYTDSRGDLWFAGGAGVSRLTPRPDLPRPPAPVYFTEIRASGRAIALDPRGQAAVPNISLRPYQNSIEVDFVGIELGTGRSLEYQYQLEGSDREWQALAGRRTIHFASLSPGNYRLLVRAVNSDGLATDPPASVGLFVATPLWRRSWALALEASMLAALAYLAHRLRLRHVLELARVRTRIATDLHDDIGASLSQIAILSEVARAARQTPEPADGHLSHIARLSRELIDSMSDIVWSINPERDRLADLTHHMRHFAADLLSARNIEFDFRGPEDDSKIDANITMLFAAALLLTGTAPAQIGVTGFDNVRLTLVNTYPPSPLAPSCSVTAALANVTPAPSTICPIGDCAASQPPPPVKLTLAPGQAATIDYAPVLAPGVRQQLRPAFAFANVLACARLAATVELFDSASARTTVLYPPIPFLPALGAAGITTADTIRLNVVAPPVPIVPPSPCSVLASILPLNSTVGLQPVALAQNTFALLPGQSAALEFSNPALAAGTRQMVLPAVKQLSGAATCLGVQTNFELYDRASARTFAFFPPSPMFPPISFSNQ
jgi:streptogramin lyase